MPRSVFEIDVKDEKFKRFLDMFKDYQGQLGKMSGFWDKSSEAAAGTEKAAMSMADSIAATAASAFLIVDALEKTRAPAQHAENSMKSMAGQAKSIAQSIEHATLRLAKWATFSLGAGLLGGGLGLFGIDSLANSVSGQRKSAQGLGITSAEQQAFNVNFGSRLVGPDFLSGIQGAKSDLSQQWMFGQLGISGAQVQGSDTADLGIDVIRRARQLWSQAGQGGHNQQWMQAHGLGGFMDFSTWQRIGQASEGDIQKYTQQYGSDKHSMGVGDATQVAWQNFAIQMERAGAQIEAVFVNGLTPLIPGLTKLSEGIEKAIAGFLGNPHMQEWLEEVNKAFEQLAGYLKSEDFNAALKSFIEGIATAARALHTAFDWMFPDANAPKPGPNWDLMPWFLMPWLKHKSSTDGQAGGIAPASLIEGGASNQFAPAKEVLDALESEESGGEAGAIGAPTSTGRAMGSFQLMPAAWAQYGHGDPFNKADSRAAAKAYLSDMLKKYHGDIAKALGAYAMGSGALDKDIAAHGSDWFDYASPEAKGALTKIAQKMHITVQVLNQTGAQIAVLTNAVQQ